MVPVLGDGELVDGQQVVVGGCVEIDDPDELTSHPSPGLPVLDLHTVDEHPVELPVAGLEGRSLRARQLAVGVVQRIDGQARIKFGEGVPQPSLQYHLIVFVALGVGGVRRDVRAMFHSPAQVGEPGEGSLFNVGFGDGGHWGSQGFTTSTSRPSKSVMFRVATARSLALAMPAISASPNSSVRPELRA